jgi:hypothetical protein
MNYLVLVLAVLGAAALVVLGAPFSWTANLGVVPLFLLAAFLLAPIALCLALRRFSVTAVLEAINISSKNNEFNSVLKPLNLATGLLFVKVFLPMPCIAQPGRINSDLIVAKGEQKELELGKINRFSVGNPEVISYKFNPKSGKLLIKGKKVGFTDLLVWNGQSKKSYGLYVLSKQRFLKTFQLADALKNLNLEIDIKGPVMIAKGEIHELADYLYLHKIKNQFLDQIFFRITLNPELRNHIIGEIYRKLFENGFSAVSCQIDWLDILCFYEGHQNLDLLKQLSQYYKISFIQQESRHKYKNFKLRLKLIQLERLDGQEIHLGLDRLQTTLEELFENGLRPLVEKNLIWLQENQSELSSLAEPEMIINLGTQQIIEIGSQIPYQNINPQGSTVIAPIDWRFAGLKIKTKISESYGKFLLDYETEFSRPIEQSISGNKEISSVLLSPGKPVKIFKIGLQTTGTTRNGIPFLNDIPLLKTIFSSKSEQKTYKHIYGYVVLEEIE